MGILTIVGSQLWLVIINDLYMFRADIAPGEADTKTLIDADAVLSGTTTGECLEVIAWWNSQILDG